MGEVELLQLTDNLLGDCPLGGLVDACIGVLEGETLGGEALPDGPVIDSAEVAQVEGSGVLDDARLVEPCLIAGDEVGGDGRKGDVTSATEAHEAMEGGGIGGGGAFLTGLAELENGELHEVPQGQLYGRMLLHRRDGAVTIGGVEFLITGPASRMDDMPVQRLVLPKGGQQLVVFALGAYRDAQTVVAELHACTVADNDALVNQVVVDGLGIGHPCQEEVGVGGIDVLADGEQLEGCHQSGAFA